VVVGGDGDAGGAGLGALVGGFGGRDRGLAGLRTLRHAVEAGAAEGVEPLAGLAADAAGVGVGVVVFAHGGASVELMSRGRRSVESGRRGAVGATPAKSIPDADTRRRERGFMGEAGADPVRLESGAMMMRATWGMIVLGLAMAVPAARAQAPAGERLREAFERLDANGDRVLERSEIPDDGLAAFDRLLKRGDASGDGKLDAEELRALGEKVRKLGGGAGGQANRQRLRAMDADGDGVVTREEYQGPAALFERLDADEDGVLRGGELRAAAPAAGAAAMTRVRAMDRDGDGRVTREEFSGRPQLFERLDSNKDGVIDDQDRQARGGRPGRGAARPDRR
jgi:Ca2+-binding EF-hand superfamily protein